MKSAYIMPHPPIARPEVGRGEEKKIQATLDAYRKASGMIAADAPETIVVVSPHSVVFSDAFYIAAGERWHGDLSNFLAPEVSLDLENDLELADEVVSMCQEKNIPVVYTEQGTDRPDHGSTVPLAFISEAYKQFKILRISPSFLPNETLLEMGRIIERAAAHVGRKITFLASGDLSHKLKEDGPYGYVKEGPEFDNQVTDIMKRCDLPAFSKFDDHFLDCAAECGLPGFIMMSGALENYQVSSEFLSYEGPFGVGYAICAFKCVDKYIALAKKTLETFIREGRQLSLSDLNPEEMTDEMRNSRNGTFVSIHKNGELRGCIGTIQPWTSCVAEEILSMAVEAGTRDPRFPAVSAAELDELVYDVDVLQPAEPASPDELDAKKYGVIVTSGYKRGLLLPNLEGVDTPGQQIRIAMMKAGIEEGEDIQLERFTVERHE